MRLSTADFDPAATKSSTHTAPAGESLIGVRQRPQLADELVKVVLTRPLQHVAQILWIGLGDGSVLVWDVGECWLVVATFERLDGDALRFVAAILFLIEPCLVG
jgi:hypothetical protein